MDAKYQPGHPLTPEADPPLVYGFRHGPQRILTRDEKFGGTTGQEDGDAERYDEYRKRHP